MILKVGRDNVFDKKKNKFRPFSYIDIQAEKDGWVDATKYLPFDQDLVYVKIKEKDKIYSAWINGISWDGLKIKDYHEILFWKRVSEQQTT